MSFVELKNVSFDYEGEPPVKAVKNVSLSIEEGSFVALAGHNGSGKSTLAKLLNGILTPKSGTVVVNGMDTADESKLYDIRKTLGIVFQNPDNQMVATIIEDDVAFGPENIGVPTEEIRRRVDWALDVVDMRGYAEKTASRLSGGQKQRIAIAGILALKPKVLVLDESTAMLDPKGRREVLETVIRLNREEKITVILITHYMEEALLADKIYIMNQGEIILSGGRELFLERGGELRNAGLDVPRALSVADALREKGVPVAPGTLDPAQLKSELIRLLKNKQTQGSDIVPLRHEGVDAKADGAGIIKAENLSFTYSPNTTFRTDALDKVNAEIYKGDFYGVIGHSGSGKSTFVQHINGLIKIQKPTRKERRKARRKKTEVIYGKITVNGVDLSGKYDRKALRASVGMVFQYPEHQLFDETVEKDAGFGPRNLGVPQEEIKERVKAAIEAVGLDYEAVKGVSPFELSGGQKRRAALAGVIAMRPEILILDEPAAGLDPMGRKDIMSLILKIKEETAATVIMISHDMDQIAKYCSRVLVLNKGKAIMELPTQEIFERSDTLRELGLDVPMAADIALTLKNEGIDLGKGVCRDTDLIEAVAGLYHA